MPIGKPIAFEGDITKYEPNAFSACSSEGLAPSSIVKSNLLHT